MTDLVGKSGVILPSSAVLRSVTLPDLTGLIGEYWLGVDAATSKKNRASGGVDMIDYSGAGAPTYSSNYATIVGASTLGASTGLDSQILPPSAVTIAVLHRQQIGGTNGARIFGSDKTAVGGTGGGGTKNYSFWNGFQDGATDQPHLSYASALDTDFHLVVGTGIIGSPGNIYAYTGGVAATDVGTRTDTTRDAVTMKLGGFVLSNTTGTVDVAWAAAFNVIKTPTQIDALYASLKAWGTSRGLTVS